MFPTTGPLTIVALDRSLFKPRQMNHRHSFRRAPSPSHGDMEGGQSAENKQPYSFGTMRAISRWGAVEKCPPLQ